MWPGRIALVQSALRLSYFTVAWNGVVGVVALVAASISGSSALAAFALSALVDSSASMVLIRRFRKERNDAEAAERLERRAQTWIAVAMLASATYVGTQAIRALIGGDHPAVDAWGDARCRVAAGLALARPFEDPCRGRTSKSSASRRRGSYCGRCRTSGSHASGIVVNSALHWWWADPGVALLIAAGLTTEAIRVSLAHRFG